MTTYWKGDPIHVDELFATLRLAGESAKAVEKGALVAVAPVAAVLAEPRASLSLDAGERAMAAAYRQAGDRDRSRAGRALLRGLLSAAAEGRTAPDRWVFGDDPNGKPRLCGDDPALHFNISHSDGAVAIALSSRAPVGVDIETLTQDGAPVEEALAPSEREAVQALAEKSRALTFLRLWTLKEAAAKALGAAMTLDFSLLETRLDPPLVLDRGGFLDPTSRFCAARWDVEVLETPYSVAAVQPSVEAGAFELLTFA